jgi:hypothetical protein
MRLRRTPSAWVHSYYNGESINGPNGVYVYVSFVTCRSITYVLWTPQLER